MLGSIRIEKAEFLSDCCPFWFRESLTSFLAAFEVAAYGASKAALEAYSRSAAVELSHYGITVNIVSPGPIQTGWIAPDMEASIVPSIPLGRLGQPEDVADVIVFLASEQARWLTGQCLHVGGGHRM